MTGDSLRKPVGVALLFMFMSMLHACDQEPISGNQYTEDAYDTEKEKAARLLIRNFGCGSCHVIPGIEGANSASAPPLDNIARQAYIGGILPNTHSAMVVWLVSPQEVNPRSAMPDLGLNEDEATRIAEYLYTRSL